MKRSDKQGFAAGRSTGGGGDVAARRLLEKLRRGGDVRAAKVRKLRAAVRAGRYENALKLSVAIDRLLEEIG